MKLVVLDGYTINPGDLDWSWMSRFGEYRIYDRIAYDTDTVVDHIADSDVVFSNKVPITKRVMERCPKIKLICVLATGYNIVDIEESRNRGICVCNVPGYSTDSVVQHTMALLLEICHNVGRHSMAVYDGKWSECKDFCFWDYPLMELSGKILGIIGYGTIGRRVEIAAKAFGMNVIHAGRGDSYDEIYSRSDVISLHCPLTDANKQMINSNSIAKMKDGVIILNTARGGLVNEDDLRDALKSGKVMAAGLDVVSEEPMRKDNPLLDAPNLFITPHIAWAPIESRARLIKTIEDNISNYVEGHPINVVNK